MIERPVFEPEISIILPAYNEEKNIEKAILQALDVMKGMGMTYEIIVVDDGSNDNTLSVISNISRVYPHIHLIRHEKNRGYGAALKSGIEASRGRLIFFTDSDLQFDMKEIKNLIEHIGKYDIICGYRKKRRDPFQRRFYSFAWKLLINALFKLYIRDINCAFKVFKREVFHQVPITSIGAFVNTEILLRAKRKGFRIKEIPVSHFPRMEGEPTGAKLKVILKTVTELAKLYRELK